jgi:hypothetical protein
MFTPTRLAVGLEPLSVPTSVSNALCLPRSGFAGDSVPPLIPPKQDHSADKNCKLKLVDAIAQIKRSEDERKQRITKDKRKKRDKRFI